MEKNNDETEKLFRSSSNLDDKKKENKLPSKEVLYASTQLQIEKICRLLSVSTEEFNEDDTLKKLETILNSDYKFDRLLYFQISNYVFNADEKSSGVLFSNAEKLFMFALENGREISQDCFNLIVKIYDHIHLANEQLETFKQTNIISIKEENDKIHQEMKDMEKDNITILGIFASIVLTFVGTITFSSSVLQSINKASIYRLILVIDLLGFIFYNVIHHLLEYIYFINEGKMRTREKCLRLRFFKIHVISKKSKDFETNENRNDNSFQCHRLLYNLICAIIAVITIIAYFINK